jgi:hypothetical protein
MSYVWRRAVDSERFPPSGFPLQDTARGRPLAPAALLRRLASRLFSDKQIRSWLAAEHNLHGNPHAFRQRVIDDEVARL